MPGTNVHAVTLCAVLEKQLMAALLTPVILHMHYLARTAELPCIDLVWGWMLLQVSKFASQNSLQMPKINVQIKHSGH